MLELKIDFSSDSITFNQPLPVRISLHNAGDTALLVNQRLAIGYENSISRELFADLLDAQTGATARYSPVKINRDAPKAQDFTWLQPGDSVQAKFDFLNYYLPIKSGRYKVTFHYQADEDSPYLPSDIWKGVVSSQPVELEILPGKMPSQQN